MTIQRAILKGSIASIVQVRNMFTCNVTLNEGDNEFDAWSEYLDTIFEDIKAHLTTSLTYTSFEVQNRVGGLWEPGDEYAVTWTGTGTGDFLPNLVAAVMIGKAIGKRLIGRKFWSGIPENSTADNHLSEQAVVAFAQGVVDYVAQFTSSGGSVLTPGVVGKDGNFHSFVTGVLSSLLGTMRRRKPGLGI